MENHCVTFRVNDALTSLITLGSIPTAVQHFYIFECCIDKIKVFFLFFFPFSKSVCTPFAVYKFYHSAFDPS